MCIYFFTFQIKTTGLYMFPDRFDITCETSTLYVYMYVVWDIFQWSVIYCYAIVVFLETKQAFRPTHVITVELKNSNTKNRTKTVFINWFVVHRLKWILFYYWWATRTKEVTSNWLLNTWDLKNRNLLFKSKWQRFNLSVNIKKYISICFSLRQ